MDEPAGDDLPLLRSAAANLAAWHESSIRALGFATTRGAWWWTAPTPTPWIYFTAVSLAPPGSVIDRAGSDRELLRHLDDPAGSFEAVCESFGRIDLTTLGSSPSGLAHRSTGMWFARPGDRQVDGVSAPVRALEIVEVHRADDLRAFEHAIGLAFRAPSPVAPFEIHAPPILDDPAMHVLAGRIDGEVVVGAMAYEAAGVLGIYGVGTVPGHRGHGHATALTRAALAVAPELTATLQPSAEAVHLYHRLGFEQIGRFTHWG